MPPKITCWPSPVGVSAPLHPPQRLLFGGQAFCSHSQIPPIVWVGVGWGQKALQYALCPTTKHEKPYCWFFVLERNQSCVRRKGSLKGIVCVRPVKLLVFLLAGQESNEQNGSCFARCSTHSVVDSLIIHTKTRMLQDLGVSQSQCAPTESSSTHSFGPTCTPGTPNKPMRPTPFAKVPMVTPPAISLPPHNICTGGTLTSAAATPRVLGTPSLGFTLETPLSVPVASKTPPSTPFDEPEGETFGLQSVRCGLELALHYSERQRANEAVASALVPTTATHDLSPPSMNTGFQSLRALQHDTSGYCRGSGDFHTSELKQVQHDFETDCDNNAMNTSTPATPKKRRRYSADLSQNCDTQSLPSNTPHSHTLGVTGNVPRTITEPMASNTTPLSAPLFSTPPRAPDTPVFACSSANPGRNRNPHRNSLRALGKRRRSQAPSPCSWCSSSSYGVAIPPFTACFTPPPRRRKRSHRRRPRSEQLIRKCVSSAHAHAQQPTEWIRGQNTQSSIPEYPPVTLSSTGFQLDLAHLQRSEPISLLPAGLASMGAEADVESRSIRDSSGNSGSPSPMSMCDESGA